jgi:hypothetical protein
VSNFFKAIAGGMVGLILATPPAAAQSVTPMRGESRSVMDSFAVRIVVGNPYKQKQYFNVRVYDERFYPVAARVSPPVTKLNPNGTRSVLVVVPFEGAKTRRVRICAEGLFGTENISQLRTQVCGRFLATHIGS